MIKNLKIYPRKECLFAHDFRIQHFTIQKKSKTLENWKN